MGYDAPAPYSPVATIHKKAYPAIDPKLPKLSQRNRTVLVTGSTGGIGLAIVRGFATAGAARIILTGRRLNVLQDATDSLSKEFPATEFVQWQLDATDIPSIETLWRALDEEGIVVDVLVLSAAHVAGDDPILELGYKNMFADFQMQVGSNGALADLFYHQKKRNGRKLYLMHVSTMTIHNWPFAKMHASYTASKAAGTAMLQHMANSIPASDMQIINFHPGSVFTPGVEKTGLTRKTMAWDDVDLPGSFAVWAASEEAEILHGRYTWAGWDVDELKNGDVAKRIATDPNYLKIGVMGLDPAPAVSEPALTDISFVAKAGDKVTITGRSGSGKSSLLVTLLNFLPHTGTILIDGIDITSLPRQLLRSRITTITQTPVLLTSSIRHNLSLLSHTAAAAPPSSALIEQTLRALNVWDAIAAKPDGLDTPLEDMGFSESQQQLLCIARAVLHHEQTGSAVLLMDEATAALSAEAAADAQRVIEEVFRGCTVLSVAHWDVSLQAPDLMLEMGDGKLLSARRADEGEVEAD